MDNKQDTALGLLFDALVALPINNLAKLSTFLKTDEPSVIQLIAQLNKMGLKVELNNKQVLLNQHITPININQLNQNLSHINKPIHYCLTTESTNKLAHKNNSPSIFMSDHQSAGKGRQSKKWITPLGQSIALTLSHHFNCGIMGLSGLNIAIGVALINTFKHYDCHHVGLKWPNDVLSKKGKVAGILIEASGNKETSKAIVGIGINWNIRQSLLNQVDQPCTNADIEHISRTDFILKLITEIENILADFSCNKLNNCLSIWNDNDIFKNQQVTIIQGQESYQAHYFGIDPNGYLKIDTDSGLKTLATGEVSIRSI